MNKRDRPRGPVLLAWAVACFLAGAAVSGLVYGLADLVNALVNR